LPLPQLGTETIPTEKVDMDEDRGPEPPADSKPVTASAPDKQAQ